jgi:hypothetical protein
MSIALTAEISAHGSRLRTIEQRLERVERVLRDPPRRSRVHPVFEAMDYLKRALAEGPVQVTWLVKDAEVNGICERTLHRARRRLGVVSRMRPTPGVGRRAYWSLPESDELGGRHALAGW